MIGWLKDLARTVYTKAKFPHAHIALGAKVSLDSILGNGVKILKGAAIGGCQISRHSYIGANCLIERTEFGPYCSVGSEVICGLATHPLHFVSTYPGFYSDEPAGSTFFGAIHNVQDKKAVKIGADVWIGSRAIILGGVRIGHGAVIGAGAIVTRDIPAYAIAVGVPARVSRFRFDETLSQRLLHSVWWEAPEVVLRQVAKFMDEPEQFLSNLHRQWIYGAKS